MLCILAVLLVLPSTAAFAEWIAPRGEDLKRFVAGKTVHLDTPLGALPITYNANGTLSAHSESLALTAYLGSTTDRGRWSVKGDRVCQKFFKWFSGDTSCLQIKAQGRKISWRRDDGMTGTALLAQNDATPPAPPSGLGVAVPPEPPKVWATASASPTFSSSAKAGAALESRPGKQHEAVRPRQVASLGPETATDVGASEPRLVEPLMEFSQWQTITRAKTASIGSSRRGAHGVEPVEAPSTDEAGAGSAVWQAFAALALQQRAEYLWCQTSTAAHAAVDGRPALLVMAGNRAPDGAIGEAGCLAPSPSIAALARSLVLAAPVQ
ncbi:MAG: hypothetical protein R3D68_16570 [Hyphomicrobiaceae bacterium]